MTAASNKYRIEQYADRNSYRIRCKWGPFWRILKEPVCFYDSVHHEVVCFNELDAAKARIAFLEKTAADKKIGWHKIWP
jgi:hypothetical protein